MEVMSSLLLCALASLSALLPQALGKQVLRSSGKDIIFNNTLLIQNQKAKHKLLLNLNGQPLVVRVNEINNVFTDYTCRKCYSCMERAMRAQKMIDLSAANTGEPHNDMLANAIKTHRDRRSTDATKDEQRKNKGKRKVSKQVTVNKYNVQGEIKALRVKETTNDEVAGTGTTCEVFSVSNAYPCDSSEGDSLLSEMKKNSRKSKREKPVALISSSTTARPVQVVYRKRNVDNTQLPENIMPSVEEMY